MVPGQAVRQVAPSPSGLTGADIARVIRQRLVLIFILWGLFSALAAGVTWLKATYAPEFRAFTYVRILSTQPVSVLNPLAQEQIRQQEVELLVQNQALLVKSQAVLGDALKDPVIKQTRWYSWAREQQDEDPIDLLSDIISATPIRDSNFLRVAAVWKERGEVHQLVNTVVETYLEKVDTLQKGAIRESREQVDEEVQRARQEYDAKRREIERLQADAEVWSATAGGPSEELLTLQALVTELEVEAVGRQAQWGALKNARPEDLPITAELDAILSADPTIAMAERAMQESEAALSEAEASYGRNHPVVKRARIRRDSAASNLLEERAVKQVRYQKEQIDQAYRNYAEALEQKDALRERLAEATAEQRDRDVKYARYISLREEADLLRLQLEQLLERQNDLAMTLRKERAVQIDVPSRAIEPTRRLSPKWEIWMPAGVFLGLAASIGIAFLLELADKSVRTPRDVPRVPVLGTIPTADDDEIEIQRVETASMEVPHSIVAEAFRALRANLFFCAPAEQQGVILITSPSGGNGKTTVATNLGISIALSGRRVLLVDANFRRAGLPRIFAGVPQEGLSNILIGQGRLGDLATSSSVPGLDILGPGPTPPNPAELLGSSYLRDLVVDARSRYDQVIFDGPPFLLVSDAMVLAGAVDGVLVVCQYRATSRGAFQRTQAQLEAINARVFGAVLNMVETRAGGYFRSTYREFYEYQEPEEEGGGSGRLSVDTKPGGRRLEAETGAVEERPGSAEVAASGGVVPEVSGDTLESGAPGAGPALEVGDLEDLGIDEARDITEPGPSSGASLESAAPTTPEGEGLRGADVHAPEQPDVDAEIGGLEGEMDAEIRKIDSDRPLVDDLGLDEDLGIDEDFGLGEDLGEFGINDQDGEPGEPEQDDPTPSS
jgi:capsular exopolysaccharide synthesis family protein